MILKAILLVVFGIASASAAGKIFYRIDFQYLERNKLRFRYENSGYHELSEQKFHHQVTNGCSIGAAEFDFYKDF